MKNRFEAGTCGVDGVNVLNHVGKVHKQEQENANLEKIMNHVTERQNRFKAAMKQHAMCKTMIPVRTLHGADGVLAINYVGSECKKDFAMS